LTRFEWKYSKPALTKHFKQWMGGAATMAIKVKQQNNTRKSPEES